MTGVPYQDFLTLLLPIRTVKTFAVSEPTLFVFRSFGKRVS
jgi:hypothetical protein